MVAVAVPSSHAPVAASPRSSSVAAPAALRLSDAERAAVVRRIMGGADRSLAAFPAAVRRVVFDRHARYVQPLIERHWPECLAERAGRKLRFLTCNLYATAPYTVLFSAPQPPFPVGPARIVGSRLGLSSTSLSRLAGLAVGVTAALLPAITERRILLFSAFIATIDHVYDHCLDGVDPVERGRRMGGLLDGTWAPDETTPHAGAFRLVRALHDEMQAGIDNADDQRELDRALSRLRDYVDAEVNAMTGVPDPSGCCWRMPGVLGTIDGLVFPVWRHAGEQARQWMYDVSLFVQVLDDYLDIEKDHGDIRPTPMLTGFWDESTLTAIWNKTLDGIVELARSSGVTDDNWLAFVRETYRMMALETAEAMGAGTAD
jgi:hypothetical protein